MTPEPSVHSLYSCHLYCTEYYEAVICTGVNVVQIRVILWFETTVCEMFNI